MHQQSRQPARRPFALPAVSLLIGAILLAPAPPASAQETAAKPEHETFNIRGRIVWMAEALERQFGIKSVAEAKERLLALEARDGTLYPIVEDIRGRSLRRDQRLRNLEDAELMVRRYQGAPLVQIIRIYSHEDGKKYELDYWCEICAIAMFELKPCDCCQGPIELRRREVE